MNITDTSWSAVTLEVAKLGGSVVVALVALWLYVPAMNGQHDRLMEVQKTDRELFVAEFKALRETINQLKEELRK